MVFSDLPRQKEDWTPDDKAAGGAEDLPGAVDYESHGSEEIELDDTEISDEEVEEFLTEINAKPIVKPTPEGMLDSDPYPNDGKGVFDIFQEMRMTPDRALLYKRGMPDQQMMLTLKERVFMIAQYAEEGNWWRARFLVRGLWRKKILRLPLGSVMWNLMIKAHVKAGRMVAAESWILDMINRVFQPDIISYNTLLHGYSRKGDYLKAEMWLRRMRARGVAPDALSYAAVANAYAEIDNLEGAERTVTAMQEALGRVESAAPYNAIFKICKKKGNDIIAQQWVTTMEEYGVQLDRVSYLLLIQASAQAGDTVGAARWLNTMLKGEGPPPQPLDSSEPELLPVRAHVAPGNEHFHAVMMSHSRAGDLKGAEAWVQVMQDWGLQPDSYSYNIWLSAAAQKGNTEAAEAIVAMMESAGLTPDLVTYSTIIGAFANAGDMEGARQWLFRAEGQGLQPDLRCYNQVIKACARAGNSSMAQHFTRRLLRNTLTPDMYTYNTLLSVFAKDGNPGDALFWIDHMQRNARWRHKDFPLHQISIGYSESLMAMVRAGNLEAAEAWLSQMIGEGVEPGAQCYNALVRGHLRQGYKAEAEKWLTRMSSWSNFRPPQELLEAVYGGGGDPPQLDGAEVEQEPLATQ